MMCGRGEMVEVDNGGPRRQIGRTTLASPQYVNEAASASELAALRRSVVRGTPYGSPKWTESTARNLGLQSTLRKPGRPRKQ